MLSVHVAEATAHRVVDEHHVHVLHPSPVPVAAIELQRTQLLKVSVSRGGGSRTSLEPNGQRTLRVAGNVGGGVEQPIEHVGPSPDIYKTPILLSRSIALSS